MHSNTTLKQVLLNEAESTYAVTEKLFRRVSDTELPWKPITGKNWMSTSQLLMHCSSFGCGKAVQGFVTGNWGTPAPMEAEQHVPPATSLPAVESVEQALDLLADDRKLTLHYIEDVNETDLLAKQIVAPWGGPEASLFQHLSLMIAHLAQHKGQLYYYLKLIGKDVSTKDLWGQ